MRLAEQNSLLKLCERHLREEMLVLVWKLFACDCSRCEKRSW